MKVIQINTIGSSGSTGQICKAVSQLLSNENIENFVFYTQGENSHDNYIKFAGSKYKKIQSIKSRLFGNFGFNSNLATNRLIRKLKSIKPDIIHLHNIHGQDVNLKKLFNYIRKNNIKTFWTFHDCWAFTGYCTHFDKIGCDKWKTGCNNCPLYKRYSWVFDRSKNLYNLKNKITQGLDLTVITPSKWLADLVKVSIFKNYPVKVINNGIDLNVFKPTESDFREKFNLDDKKIVLAVAQGWGVAKPLDTIIDISNRLDDSYKLIVVGTNDEVDKTLPQSILSIHRTESQTELAKIYSASDVFINTTREDTFPTVNIEALACGTPIITFRTGGSPEILDETCGVVVPKNDNDAMLKEIIRVCEETPYSTIACVERAKNFNKDDKFLEYLDLYKK